MEWEHTCSLAWLNARQVFITASSIKDIIPYTKTGRPRKINEEQYLKLIANMYDRITPEDCISTGAAARGHILEPYAIEEYNRIANAEYLFHWDDALIFKDKDNLAYSPDALDIKQCDPSAFMIKHTDISPNVLGEVKCYGKEKHLRTIFEDKLEVEERWQIATAMSVNDSIEKAVLILFNPSLKLHSIGWHEYTRNDLAHEIEVIKETVDLFNKWRVEVFPYMVTNNDVFKCLYTEEDIYELYKKSQRLNP